jgi:hypothetical protein
MLSQELTHGSTTRHHVEHACAGTHVAITCYKPLFVSNVSGFWQELEKNYFLFPRNLLVA